MHGVILFQFTLVITWFTVRTLRFIKVHMKSRNVRANFTPHNVEKVMARLSSRDREHVIEAVKMNCRPEEVAAN